MLVADCQSVRPCSPQVPIAEWGIYREDAKIAKTDAKKRIGHGWIGEGDWDCRFFNGRLLDGAFAISHGAASTCQDAKFSPCSATWHVGMLLSLMPQNASECPIPPPSPRMGSGAAVALRSGSSRSVWVRAMKCNELHDFAQVFSCTGRMRRLISGAVE